MIKKVLTIALGLTVAAGFAYGAPFKVGEKLVFSVSWSDIVKAGTATLSVPGVKVFNGHKVYHIISTASSGPQVSAFFYTRDRIDVYLDAQSYTIWKSEKHLVEGTYKNDEVIYFDPVNRTAVRGVKTMRTLPNPRDALGGFYYCRSLDLAVGNEITVNYADGKISKPIVVKVLRKHGLVRAGHGVRIFLRQRFRHNARQNLELLLHRVMQALVHRTHHPRTLLQHCHGCANRCLLVAVPDLHVGDGCKPLTCLNNEA